MVALSPEPRNSNSSASERKRRNYDNALPVTRHSTDGLTTKLPKGRQAVVSICVHWRLFADTALSRSKVVTRADPRAWLRRRPW
jgi:hypothetical protein